MQHTTVTYEVIEIIMHSNKETLLFDKNEFKVMRSDSSVFDVEMGYYDGAT